MPRITKRYKLPFKRRFGKKTDYRARLKSARSGKMRAVVRKSLENLKIQFIKFEPAGDKTLSETDTSSLKSFGWSVGTGNLSAAYLTGLLAGLRAKSAGIDSAILDIGLQTSTKGSRLYAAAKGILDAGLKMKVSEAVLPKPERINGSHISQWASSAKNKNSFTKYKILPKDLPKHFEEVKQKILSEAGKTK